MISLFKNNIYIKISTIFLIYFSLLFYLKYEINITFLIISFILFICIILAIYNNNDKLNLLFKKSDDLYFNATNTKKIHSSLDEIITTINFIENVIKKNGKRGFGYWFWKPYLILKVINELKGTKKTILHSKKVFYFLLNFDY